MSKRTRNGPRDDSPPPAPDALAVDVLDAHCHLDIMAGFRPGLGEPAEPVALELSADGRSPYVDEALAAAAAVGVGTVVQVGVDLPSSRWSVQVAAGVRLVHAAVALHPNEAGRGAATDEALREVEALAALPQVVAVGETGLDHYRTEGDDGHRRQEDSFRAHIAIAKRTGTALMIHDRDAHDDVVRVLLDEGAPDRVVFHCFSGGVDLARTCAEHGWSASFAGTVTFKNADGAARGGGGAAARAAARGDRRAVPHPGAVPRPARTPRTWSRSPCGRWPRSAATDVDELSATLMANGRRVFGLSGARP